MNQYCYCGNDPINYADPSGRFAISLTTIGLILGVAAGATAGGVIAYNVAQDMGAEGWELFGWTMAGIFGGGIIGGALGAGIGTLIAKTTGILGFSIAKGSIVPIKNITLLGHLSNYIKLAEKIGAGVYHTTKNIWKYGENAYQLAINLQYLKDASSLGSLFLLMPDEVVKGTSVLIKEIYYLIENGIPWVMW